MAFPDMMFTMQQNGRAFELTEISSNGGIPVRIPDFTRGDWDQLDGLKFAK